MHRLLPPEVILVLTELEKRGFEGYLVGGAVRDLLLGLQPLDYDIATSAIPEEVLAIAQQKDWKVIDNFGRMFGVVMLQVGAITIEVATFRGERYGIDSHRPNDVWFTKRIEEDLKRRDFTINAMAMNAQGRVVDLFGGRQDLLYKVIRCVGDATIRFNEDALRMLRACRFASQLGFKIENDTLQAFSSAMHKVEGLSLDRIKNELNKMLLGKYPEMGLDPYVLTGLNKKSLLPELTHLVGLAQNPTFHKYDAWRHTIYTVKAVPGEIDLRWGALLHDVGKGMPGVRAYKNGEPTDHGHDKLGASMAEDILIRLKYSEKFVKHVSWLVLRHMKFHYYFHKYQDSSERWVRSEARTSRFRSTVDLESAYTQLVKLCLADMVSCGAKSEVVLKAEEYGLRLSKLAGSMPVHTSDLAVTGKDIMNIVKEDYYIGDILKYLLRRVQDGNLANEREILLKTARKIADKNASFLSALNER